MSEQSSPSTMRDAVRHGLLSLTGAGGLGEQITDLRNLVDASATQADATNSRIDGMNRQLQAVAHEVEALAVEVRKDTPALLERMESVERLERTLSTLGSTVTQLSERVHVHEVDIASLRSQLERLAGSIQDETALDRRLRRIEDRLLLLQKDS